MQSIASQVNLLKSTRKNVQKIMDNYSLEQLNTIPTGFSNNLIWNYGHVTVTHQLLTYGLAGLEMNMDSDLISKYRKGTKPGQAVSEEEYSFLKNKFSELPQQFLSNCESGSFAGFKKYETSFGVTLNSIEDAVSFNNLHEALHLGAMLGIRKFL